MEVFPEGVMVHRNILQAEGMHYPRQQETAMKILNKWEMLKRAEVNSLTHCQSNWVFRFGGIIVMVH